MELTLILLIRKKNEGKKITILEYKIVSQIGQVLQSTVTGTRAQGGGVLCYHPSIVKDGVFWKNLFYNLAFYITKLRITQ